jgi:CPA1 family monovalent cation:H+ antiporter
MIGSETPVPLLILVGVLLAMPVIAFVSHRLRLPYTVAMVVVGLVVSAFTGRGNLEVSPAIAVTMLLPGLVFEAAYRLDAAELRRTFGGVALLAIPGVIVVAAVVAVVLHDAAGLPVEEAFIVGAMVSATDPVAVVATMRQLRAPSRLVTLIDAESLFNDGTAVLVYAIGLGALHEGHSLSNDVVTFAFGIVASVTIGAASGWLIARVAARTTDYLIELTLTLLAAYGTYVLADLLHQSGIIAVVVAGIVTGTYGRRVGFSARAREAIDIVWEFLAFVLTAVTFLLIGSAIPLGTLRDAAVPIAWGVIAVLVARALVVYGLLGGSSRILSRFGAAPRMPVSWLHVMNWTGLRGAVAIALALSLPADVPDRTLLQGTTFGIVLFTVLVQGATAERVMRWARPTPDPEPGGTAEAPGRSTRSGVSPDGRRLPGGPGLPDVDALEDPEPGGHADQ